MRERALSQKSVARERSGESLPEGLRGADADLERKFWIALSLYGMLAVLAWFTMGAEKVLVMGRPVEMRWLPILVLGAFALRTVVARHADRIRRDGSRDGTSAS